MRTCGTIAPEQEDMCGYPALEYIAECVREYNHDGDHVFVTPDGRRIGWRYDWECGCCGDEPDRCTIYGEIDATSGKGTP